MAFNMNANAGSEIRKRRSNFLYEALIVIRSNLQLKTQLKPAGELMGLHFNAKDFLTQGLQGAKAIQVSTLLEGSQFDWLYRNCRDISDDAAHVSHLAEPPQCREPTRFARFCTPTASQDRLRLLAFERSLALQRDQSRQVED
ncbi:hypothetical protein [Pleomorphomonas sp. T1.2MG-36]|uniref:hypothetical protein n=1 Tax=Pleomorphomonas sp. T1.2MG-36 TaxID=3041167 RepID=UPI002541EF0C|nr:hypothetical protein [Pleomorphomonas sp. T1.2MG-36]